MSDFDSTLPNTLHSRVTAKRKQSIWPMMIFKHIVGQKPFKIFSIASILFLFSITWVTIIQWQNSRDELDSLNQELQHYKEQYQQQLTTNRNLQDSLQEQDHDKIDNLGDDSIAPPTINFEQALATIDNSEQITFPLPPAIEASLFRMIPNDIPVDYRRISSPYGDRLHPISGQWKRHLGMDLTCPLGTPVFATADGVVEITRPSNQGYGNLIKLRHAFGFITLYAHLNQFSVKTGQFVEKGDRIGFCGSSGNSTGSHLHYEVRFIGKTLDPQDFIQWQPDNLEQLFNKQSYVPWASLVKQLNRTVNLQLFLAMSSKQPINDIANQPSKLTRQDKIKRKKGLQDFGLNEDGWTTVNE
ncbi:MULTISPECIES: M23 family metallopeptidase [Vibrio]|uniref:M23 family peptidase n=1 Tax=Vibrio casei TaxID=673372 RepID=A0A368LLA2_9VIBR|nr:MULTISPECIES: M23 family metallopeptidase [Vibrio]RCS72608.1 M23 family peptidase [Vibrio casei]HBV74810.1 M23 family peptidase [Vibrio sp.]